MNEELFAQLLFDLNISEESILETKELFEKSTPLQEALQSPVIAIEQKHSVIDKLFPKEIQSFLKVLCDHNKIDIFFSIVEQWENKKLEKENILKATLCCVTEPDEKTIEQLKAFLCKKENKSDVILEVQKDETLLRGFVLKTGTMEYDRSLKNALKEMRTMLCGGERQ